MDDCNQDDARITDDMRRDLRWLQTEHGINGELIKSLLGAPGEARAHISFFRKMTFGVSIVLMTVSMSLTAYGARGVSGGGGWWNYIIAGVFGLAFLHCSLMFVRGIQAANATEAVARKYGLL